MRRHYSRAVEALHREAWEDATVEGADALMAVHAAPRAPFPGIERLDSVIVRMALHQIAWQARERLAQAAQVRMVEAPLAARLRAS